MPYTPPATAAHKKDLLIADWNDGVKGNWEWLLTGDLFVWENLTYVSNSDWQASNSIQKLLGVMWQHVALYPADVTVVSGDTVRIVQAALDRLNSGNDTASGDFVCALYIKTVP